MKEREQAYKFPTKLDVGLLLVLSAAAFGIFGNASLKEEPLVSPLPSPTPIEVPIYQPSPTPTLGPLMIANRVFCRDSGAYSDKKLNQGCEGKP